MFKYIILVALIATSCSHKSKAPSNIGKIERLLIQDSRPLHEDRTGQVLLGGLSDLVYSSGESNAEVMIFYAITDRGPNKKTIGPKNLPQRPFVFPEFVPQIVKLEYQVRGHEVRVVERRPLIKPDSKNVRGLPNTAVLRGGMTVDEQPVDTKNQILALDPWGLDPEGLALDDQGYFWLAEEYGPSLLKVAPDGKVIKRWYPQGKDILRGGQPELPAFLSRRYLNRGFEAAVWLKGGKLLLFLQSELPASSEKMWAPVVEFDTIKEITTAIYFYPLSKEGGKIGAASLDSSGKIYLLEQNGKTGAQAWQRIFELQLANATNVLKEAQAQGLSYRVSERTVPIHKRESVNLMELGLQDFEKLEGLSLLSEQEMYILNDNDFDVEGKADDASKSYIFRLKRN